jgi:hypothetical protein
MKFFPKLFNILYMSFRIIIFKKDKYTTRSFSNKNDIFAGYDMRYPLTDEKNLTQIININKNIQKKYILNKLSDPKISNLTKLNIIKQAEMYGLLNINKKKELFF